MMEAMSTELNQEIVEAIKQQPGKPLQVHDAAGQVYILMTNQQFQQYIYDDSELTPEEMIAAASIDIDETEEFEVSNMDEPNQNDSESEL